MKAIALRLIGIVVMIFANILWFLVAVVAANIILGAIVTVAKIIFAMIRPIITRPIEERIGAEKRQAAMEESMKDSAKWFAEYTAIMKKEKKEVTDAA